MALDTLSQEEIDKLLNSIGSGDEESEKTVKEALKKEDKVREYNFRRPVKFSREQQRTLQLIHENFSRELSTYLSGRCRTFVEVKYASIDQITFSEFQQSLSSPTFMAIFSTDTLSGSAIMQMGLDVGYVIIDKLLGGPGIAMEDLRSPTEIELSILRKESSVLLRSLSKAWTNISEFEVSLDKIETNPQFVQIASPNDMTVLITLSITVRDVQGFINICFPSSTLESINDKLYMRIWSQSAVKSEKNKEDIKNLLLTSSLNISAILGNSVLTLGQMLKMQIGDVIRLDSFYEEPLEVKVQGETIFLGKVGTNKGYYSMKIEKEDTELLEKLMLEKALIEREYEEKKLLENKPRKRGGEL
jgi:flagellar motor switch protein FliM